MADYRQGAENLPLRKINTKCPILVMVIDIKTEDIVQDYKMDYANYEDRKWLGRLTYWAVTNHHSIETMALSDVDIPTIENKE